MARTDKARGFLAAALLGMSLPALAFTGGPLRGTVLDRDSNEPIPGVIVVVRWDGHWSRLFAESTSACYHVETTRTDAGGRYQIPAWVQPPQADDFRFTSGGFVVSLFKPGYVDLSAGSSGTTLMQRFSGTNDEYFETVLDSKQWQCAQSGESRRHLYRVFKAAAADARSRAVTPLQLSKVRFLEGMMEDALVDRSKPTTSSGGRLVNVDPRDNFPPEE
jgi:hypothetical protein